MHRAQRGVEIVRAGTFDKADLATTALRIVRLEPGCAVLEVEPMVTTDEGGLAEDASTLPEITIARLTSAITHGASLPAPVVDELETARRECGGDGQFTIYPPNTDDRAEGATFDEASIAATRESPAEAPEDSGPVTSIAGRLIRLSEAPEQVMIREPDGTEWLCHFDDAVAEDLGPLWRHTVWARGEGERRESGKARFKIESVQRAIFGSEQSELFTIEQVPSGDVIARYGLAGPQGSEVLSPDEPLDTASEERYLEALLGEG